MARFSSELIERLKREVSVERLAEAAGVKLKRHGQDLIGLCRFHDDREPSLVVSPKTNLWHCLGKCQQGGSSIDWVMKANGVSFRHAVELMREDVTAVASSPARPLVRSTVRRLPAPIERDADDRELLKQVVRFYHETLKSSTEALAYLEGRGLSSAEMIDHFQLGYGNRTLGYRLPEKNRQAGEEMRTRLQRLGILRDSGHEHFAGSIVVPVLDENGDVAALYGRKVTPNLRKGTPLHLYLPGPHRGVFNPEALQVSKEVILCEALLDALTFWRHGIRNVTSSYGAGGFTDDHLEAFRRHGTETVLIAYDRDEAGDKGAADVAEKLIALGIGCYRVQFPHGMDANEYARKVEPAPKALDVLLRSAAWLGGPTRRAPARFSLVAAAKEKGEAEAARDDGEIHEARGEATAPGTDPVTFSPEDPDLPEAKTAPATVPEGSITPSPAVPLSPASLATEPQEQALVVRIEDRAYRLRGLPELVDFKHLLVNVLIERGAALYVERVDLYSRAQRTAFAKEAALEVNLPEDLLKRDLGLVLRAIEEHLEEKKRAPAEPPPPPAAAMSEQDKAAALELLRDPRLLERILTDFERCAVIGEETNKLVGYLAAVSRKLQEPLAIMVQSSSAAGKSSLMEAVLSFVPPEDRIKYSAMTGQSLYYLGETNLKHKVLAIVEEEGAEKASYALKLLQSEGELTIASTGKDAQTGRLVTQEYRVEGPVMIFLTTTASEVDEELLNRCIVLTVNEEREQTRAIHRLQRENETLEGLKARHEREGLRALHRNAQRLLRPLAVANPFARELTFLDDRTRTRRDHLKYLTLIRSITLVHQHQREVRTMELAGKPVEYVETTLADIATANRLAHEVLGRSLDELSPQTRRLLGLLEEMVSKETERRKVRRSAVRFTRREVREATGWGQTQLRIHLARLVELEYLLVHHGGNGVQFQYELLYDGKRDQGRSVLCGLIDPSSLASGRGYDGNLAGSEGHLAGTWRPACGQLAGTLRVPGNGASPHPDAAIVKSLARSEENAHLEAGPARRTVPAPEH